MAVVMMEAAGQFSVEPPLMVEVKRGEEKCISYDIPPVRNKIDELLEIVVYCLFRLIFCMWSNDYFRLTP